MPVKCQVVIDALEKMAPRYLAENWDNVGLIVGSMNQAVSKIMIALDVDENVVAEAVESHADLIIAHHPLIFKNLKSIRTDLPFGRLISSLIKNDISVYAAHTNLDIATGGVNDVLAAKLQLSQVEPLDITRIEKLIKLVVFVPAEHAEAVRNAVAEAGAGFIGNYSHCTFMADGRGTFMPLSGTHPYIGRTGELEDVPEVRLETIMPEGKKNKVISAMLKAHPYEEVAYDLYELINAGRKFGLGRIGLLHSTVQLSELVNKVKEVLGIDSVGVVGDVSKAIKSVAVCGGSGADMIGKAAAAGADVFITGDVKYHDAQAALEAGIAVIDAGHFSTERVVIDALHNYLEKCACKGRWIVEINSYNVNNDILKRY